MKPVPAPKLNLNLKERLCFYCRKDNDNDKATDIIWPAVFYYNLQEYFSHLQDNMDDRVKTKLALEIISSVKTDADEVNILRPLGKNQSLADYIEFVNGKDQYYRYQDHICRPLRHVKNPNAFTSDEEYLRFMDALTESEEILRGPENLSNEMTWREFGEKTLRARQNARHDSDVAMVEEHKKKESAADKEIRTLDFQEAASESVAFDAAAEASSTETDAGNSKDQGLTDASQHFSDESGPQSTAMEDDASCAAFEAPVVTQTYDASSSKDSTPRTHNHSSSATVVSMDASVAHEENSTCGTEAPSRKEPWPFDYPDLNESMSDQDIAMHLQFVGWTTRVFDGRTFYMFPNVCMNTAKRGENGFFLEELINFVRKNNYFQNVSRKLFSPSSETKTLNFGEAKTDEQERQTTQKSSKTRTKPAGTSTKNARVTKKNARPVKHQNRNDRGRNVRVSPRLRGGSLVTPIAKSKVAASDPFYEFKCLISVLRQKFMWKYLMGVNLCPYMYIRGDSKLGKNGTHGDDFFVEEHEVIKYCMKHDYKAKYEQLLKIEDAESEESGKVPIVDPNFKTPSPSKRVGTVQ